MAPRWTKRVGTPEIIVVVVVVVVVAMVAKQIFLYRLAPNELDTGNLLHDGVF